MAGIGQECRALSLFAGEKPPLDGVRVLDSSDMLGLLGMGNGPVHLAEGKVNASKPPNMTAQEWKKSRSGWTALQRCLILQL